MGHPPGMGGGDMCGVGMGVTSMRDGVGGTSTRMGDGEMGGTSTRDGNIWWIICVSFLFRKILF